MLTDDVLQVVAPGPQQPTSVRARVSGNADAPIFANWGKPADTKSALEGKVCILISPDQRMRVDGGCFEWYSDAAQEVRDDIVPYLDVVVGHRFPNAVNQVSTRHPICVSGCH
jgi:hypothetical protein